MYSLESVIVLLVSTTVYAAPNHLSESCTRKSPNFQQCTYQRFLQGYGVVLDGIPELDIPPLDPVVLHDVAVAVDLKIVTVDMVLGTLRFDGQKDLSFTRFMLDPDTLEGELELYGKYIRLQMDFDARIKVFHLPLHYVGFVDSTIIDHFVNITYKLKEVEENGTKHFKVDYLKFAGHVNHASVRFTSPNPTQQIILKLVEFFINHNDNFVLKVSNHLFTGLASSFFQSYLENALSKYPSEYILPS